MRSPTLVNNDNVVRFLTLVQSQKLVAFSAPPAGDISRVGSLNGLYCEVQTETTSEFFFVDFSISPSTAGCQDLLIETFKMILEDESINKVVHDCRQLSDVLLHHLGIRLCGVFDTAVWDMCVNSTAHCRTLKELLHTYAPKQDNSDESASTRALLLLYRSMLRRVGPDLELTAICEAQCKIAVDVFRSLPCYEQVVVPGYRKCLVIGKDECNLRAVENVSGAVVAYNNKKGFVVLATDPAKLKTARAAIESYAGSKEQLM